MAPATANRSRQGEAVAELVGGEVLDWDGNEIGEVGDYLDYLNSRPTRAQLRRYDEPVFYWEVKYPGCALQPYPQMSPMRSSDEGLWRCDNDAQQAAVREHIQIQMHRDPDDFRVTDAELQALATRDADRISYCKTCAFTTTNIVMANLHRRESGHESSDKPRAPFGMAAPQEG